MNIVTQQCISNIKREAVVSVYYDGEQAQSLPWIESKESWIFLRHILVEFVQDTK